MERDNALLGKVQKLAMLLQIPEPTEAKWWMDIAEVGGEVDTALNLLPLEFLHLDGVRDVIIALEA